MVFKYWKASPRRSRIICSPKGGCRVEWAMEKLHWWRFIWRLRKETLCSGEDKILKYLAYGGSGISVTGDRCGSVLKDNSALVTEISDLLRFLLSLCHDFAEQDMVQSVIPCLSATLWPNPAGCTGGCAEDGALIIVALCSFSTLGEAWAQLKKSLADEAEVHLKFSSKVNSSSFLQRFFPCHWCGFPFSAC